MVEGDRGPAGGLSPLAAAKEEIARYLSGASQDTAGMRQAVQDLLRHGPAELARFLKTLFGQARGDGNMPDECGEIPDHLPEYLELGAAGPERFPAIPGHLASCPACTSHLALLEEVSRHGPAWAELARQLRGSQDGGALVLTPQGWRQAGTGLKPEPDAWSGPWKLEPTPSAGSVRFPDDAQSAQGLVTELPGGAGRIELRVQPEHRGSDHRQVWKLSFRLEEPRVPLVQVGVGGPDTVRPGRRSLRPDRPVQLQLAPPARTPYHADFAWKSEQGEWQEHRIEIPLRVEGPAEGPPIDPPIRHVPPVDLDLQIFTVTEEGRTRLDFILHSPQDASLYFHQSIPGNAILGSPEDFQRYVLERIQAAGSWRDIERLGIGLYEELFSDEMRNAYRRFRERVHTLQITSNEPWIPWELIKPFDPDHGIDDDFLSVRFQMTRWIANGPGPATHIEVSKGVCVEVGSPPRQPSLRHAPRERQHVRDYLKSSPGTSDLSDLCDSPATRQAVDKLLDTPGIGLWHFCVHGVEDPAHSSRRVLLLADGYLKPENLHGYPRHHISKARPLVFINACRASLEGWLLTRLGGWAGAWVDRSRCGAFIGPLWSVDDGAAYKFSCAFYDALWEGKTIGLAVKAAQKRVRDADPNDFTWLAYSVYAHPNAYVELKPDPEA
jgi:CHAT domain-containing protein